MSGENHGDCFCIDECSLAGGEHRFTVEGTLVDPTTWGAAIYWVAGCAAESLHDITRIEPATVSVGAASGHPSVALRGAPSPLVTSTTFVTDVPEAGKVTLTVYDGQGREVARPFAGMHPEEPLRVTWDARGDALEPGVYFARLSREGRALATCRIVLAR